MILKHFFRKRINPLIDGMLHLPPEEAKRILRKYPHEYKWRKLYFDKVNKMTEARNTCIFSGVISFFNLLVTLMSNKYDIITMIVAIVLLMISSIEIIKINKLNKHNKYDLSNKIKERIYRFDLEYIGSLIEKNKKIRDAIEHLEKQRNDSFIA